MTQRSGAAPRRPHKPKTPVQIWALQPVLLMSPKWAKPERVKDTPQYLPARWVRDKALAEIAKREVRDGLATHKPTGQPWKPQPHKPDRETGSPSNK